MKIVINRCYGGYSLSPLAINEWAKVTGKTAYFYEHSGYGKTMTVTPLTLKQAQQTMFWVAFDALLPMPTTSDNFNKFWSAHVIGSRPENRSDPQLIEVIERIGVAAASGLAAELAIVEIPDGVSYEIDEYDGVESIHETHRSWS